MLVIIAACIAAAGSITSALITYKNQLKINGVHTLVNQNRTDMVNRIDQLTDTLKNSDIEVPDNGKGGVR